MTPIHKDHPATKKKREPGSHRGPPPRAAGTGKTKTPGRTKKTLRAPGIPGRPHTKRRATTGQPTGNRRAAQPEPTPRGPPTEQGGGGGGGGGGGEFWSSRVLGVPGPVRHSLGKDLRNAGGWEGGGVGVGGRGVVWGGFIFSPAI